MEKTYTINEAVAHLHNDGAIKFTDFECLNLLKYIICRAAGGTLKFLPRGTSTYYYYRPGSGTWCDETETKRSWIDIAHIDKTEPSPSVTNPENKMRIVYIAHPVSGAVEKNIEKIIAIVRRINMDETDVVPLVPYLADLYALDDSVPTQRARGIANDIAVLRSGMIDEVWLYGDRISAGMQAEVELAKSLGIPVLGQTFETRHALRKQVFPNHNS